MEPSTNTVKTSQHISSQAKFKSKNPNYFKNYYQNNKHKYNNTSQKKKWYGIEIFGTVYVFDHKSDIIIKNIDKQTLNEANIVRVKS